MTAAAPLDRLVRHLRQATQSQPLDQLADADLLDRFRHHGDAEAFAVIVRRHGPCVMAACRHILSAEADMEDTFQATFVVLLQNAGAIRQRGSLRSFLYGVAHRLALKALHSARRRRQVELKEGPGLEKEVDPSWQEACAILHEELDRLPDNYRLPLLLCYLEGMRRDEAAQQLGCTLDVLRGRLERGRDRLRDRLTKRGVMLSAGLLAAVAKSGTAGSLPERLFRATLVAVSGEQVPVPVLALIEGFHPWMSPGKWQLAAITLLALGLFGGLLAMPRAFWSSAHSSSEPQLAAPELAREEEPEPNQRTVAVSGKVIGPDGQPVAKARLLVFDSEGWRAAPQAESGPDGGFAFELPPIAGRRSYSFLVATAPDLGLGCDWEMLPGAAEPLRDAVLKLPPDLPIRGRIVDLEGKPVAGAQVRVTDLGSGEDDTLNLFVRLWSADRENKTEAFATLQGKRLMAKKATADYFRATTNAEGRFTLTGIGRDRCPRLTVSAGGKASQVAIVPQRPDFQPAAGGITGSPVLGPVFTLPISPSKPIMGVVRDEAGKPLAGVRVHGRPELAGFQGGYIVLPDVEAVTDAQGRYNLDGLPLAEKYYLLADPKPGSGLVHRYVTRTRDVRGFAPLQVNIDLPQGVVLSGRITERATGLPVRSWVVYHPLWSNPWVKDHPDYHNPGRAPSAQDTEAWTDAAGRFQLTAVGGPGIVFIWTERPSLLARLSPEDDRDPIVGKDLLGAKVFKTSDPGYDREPNSMNGYRVCLIPTDARAFTADLTVAAGGQRLVKIVGPDGQPISGAWVANKRLLDGFSAKPLPGAEVLVQALDPDKPRRIYAQHDSKNLAGMITLDSKETGPAVLQLQPTATVVGRILDPEGKPLKDVRIRPLYIAEGEVGSWLHGWEAYTRGPVFTDAEGRFTLPNIPALMRVEFEARKKDSGVRFDLRRPWLWVLRPGEVNDLGDWKGK